MRRSRAKPKAAAPTPEPEPELKATTVSGALAVASPVGETSADGTHIFGTIESKEQPVLVSTHPAPPGLAPTASMMPAQPPEQLPAGFANRFSALESTVAELEKSARALPDALRAVQSAIHAITTTVPGLIEAQLCTTLDRYRAEDRAYVPSDLFVNAVFNNRQAVYMSASSPHPTVRRLELELSRLNQETIVPFMAEMGFTLRARNMSSWNSYYRCTPSVIKDEFVYDMTFHRKL